MCDRCLRLKKTCIFPPARRGNAPAQRKTRISQLEAEIARLDNILGSQQGSGAGSNSSPVSDRGASRSSSTAAGEEAGESTRVQPVNGVSLDPFELGLLSIETGNLLLDRFRISLTPYFPFVIMPESLRVADLHREKPIVCLAILFASSHDNGVLQARLSRLFEQMLAIELLQGRIASLENLQGLLIYTAWMQYQPRPRKHTQNIFLAMSIMYDLRFHKPREVPRQGDEDGERGVLAGGLRADELRAVIGLFSVALSASAILDKFHCFPTIPSLAESCETLAMRAEYPTDKYLSGIFGLLHLIWQVDKLVKDTIPNKVENSKERLGHLFNEWRFLKQSLNRTQRLLRISSHFLRFQIPAAELLMADIVLPGSSVFVSTDPSPRIAETIPVVKSLMEILLSSEPGQELYFTNLAWIKLGYGLSLGVKLDVLCTTCGISPATAIELRQSLDISSTLSALIKRMRMSISHSTDTEREGPHPLCQFLSRAEAVERWYARHGPPAVSNAAMPWSQHGPETFTGRGQVNEQQGSLPSHSHPAVEGDALLRPEDNQDLGFAFDPDMSAFEGLDFEGMDFAMDPQEAWNPFVFPDGAY